MENEVIARIAESAVSGVRGWLSTSNERHPAGEPRGGRSVASALARSGSWVAWQQARRILSLRWVYTHMIEEYARHNGHADLLRQRNGLLTHGTGNSAHRMELPRRPG
jgi:hypothetical protein